MILRQVVLGAPFEKPWSWAFSALGKLAPHGPSHQKRALKAPHTLVLSPTQDTKPADLIPSTQGQKEAMRAERLSSKVGGGGMDKTVTPTFLLEDFSALSLSVSRRGNTGCLVSCNYLTREHFFPPICG